MKKTVSLFLSLALALSLTGCRTTPRGGDPSGQTTPALSAAEVIMAMVAACPGESTSNWKVPEADLPLLVEHYYGLTTDQWEDAAIVQAGGALAFELTVIRLTDGADTNAARQGMQDYLTSRQGDFTGYSPDQAALCANGMVMRHGQYLALAITETPEDAFSAFSSCFTGGNTEGWSGSSFISASSPETHERYPYADPHTDDMTLYDTSAILAAWTSGNRSGLSEKDRTILAAAEQVLNEMLTDGMSDYEKEVALYLWVTHSVSYDMAHEDPSPFVHMDPDSPSPYGALVNRKAICLGFASTFQLLADMAGLECITVRGAAFHSTENHAWNMVRLGGKWYCVDATWDESRTAFLDPASMRYVDTMDAWRQGELNVNCWGYFNVTSDWMAESDHQWDYDSVPEAVAQDGGRL